MAAYSVNVNVIFKISTVNNIFLPPLGGHVNHQQNKNVSASRIVLVVFSRSVFL